MFIKRFFETKLAQTSYMIGCPAAGECIVIDPNRDADQYLKAAEAEGVRIAHITETHIHADFLSGSRELAARTGGTLYVSDEGDAAWKYAFADEPRVKRIKDGDTITVGNVRLDVMHTPGHTPEHVSFLVTDCEGASEPIAAATGDFLFVGDVGRPDLLERAANVKGTMESGAKTLFASLRRFESQPGLAADLAGARRRVRLREGNQRDSAEHARVRAPLQLGVQARQRGELCHQRARRPAGSAEVLRRDEAAEQGRPAGSARLPAARTARFAGPRSEAPRGRARRGHAPDVRLRHGARAGHPQYSPQRQLHDLGWMARAVHRGFLSHR
jgi:glyoxylase-like metal-dependent hydrolase (beta-lactamase superfamily II)